jgi:hypothetical protein
MKIRESDECGKSELDLFSIPPTQTQMEEARYDLVKPFSNFTNGTITFEIEGDNQCYIDLSATELMITCKVMNNGDHITNLADSQIKRKLDDPRPVRVTTNTIKTGTDYGTWNATDVKYTAPVKAPVVYTPEEVTENDKKIKEWDTKYNAYLGPVNNFLHSLFSQVQVRIGNTEVENTNANYPFRAYFENLLCYGKDQKETFLQNEMFYKDTASNMDDVLFANQGLVDRRNRYTNQKGYFHMKGRLKSDIFSMNRYMLPQVNLQVVLTRSSPTFCMMSDEKWGDANYQNLRIDITEAALQVRRVKVSQAVILQHAMQLEKTAAKYPVRRVIMRCLNTPFKAQSFYLSGIHRGIMPSRVVVAFVENAAYTGSLTKNPFNFLNLNVRSLKLKMASVNLPYSDGLTIDYKKNQYMQAYDALHANLGNISNDITYNDFANGYTIYPFDLTPDQCDSAHFNLLRDGALELECVMEEIYEQAFQAVFYLQFENVIEITKERGVQFDFSIV